jgi:hypothetical protein
MNNSYNYYIKKVFLKSILLFYIIFLHIRIKEKLESLKDFLKNEFDKMSLVIPIISKDFYKISNNFKFYINFIDDINNVVFIGNEETENLIKEMKTSLEFPINFINEKVILDVDKIKELIKKRNETAVIRSGWYIQQFLKMIYCNICQDKYYLIWDSDTIPVKKVKMFKNNGKPLFDVKTEYHEPYFITMKSIFPELGKKYDYSFISEHMIISTKLMKNMINRISDNNNLFGNTWYEKIINNIESNYLSQSGFSEFETYGTFVKEHYRLVYSKRRWKSLRVSKLYFNPKFLTINDIKNFSKYYNSISIENWI